VSALAADFYDRSVLEVARELIGCTVEHRGRSGVIVETEAYHESEPACHAFAGLTPRTRTLFGAPGCAYVYRSYGVHALLNAVCEPEGVGAAVLIRALEPREGVGEMRVRREASVARADGRRSLRDTELCSGPGKLTQALGIWLSENGGDLSEGPITIAPRAGEWRQAPLAIGPRVGITKAVELPWRFCAAGNRHVSSPRPMAGRWLRRSLPG
jgi:DNA-3-methyladenine glycosylase